MVMVVVMMMVTMMPASRFGRLLNTRTVVEYRLGFTVILIRIRFLIVRRAACVVVRSVVVLIRCSRGLFRHGKFARRGRRRDAFVEHFVENIIVAFVVRVHMFVFVVRSSVFHVRFVVVGGCFAVVVILTHRRRVVFFVFAQHEITAFELCWSSCRRRRERDDRSSRLISNALTTTKTFQ